MHCLPAHAWTDCPVGNRQYHMKEEPPPGFKPSYETTVFYEIRKGPLTDNERFRYHDTLRNFWIQTQEYARKRGTIPYTVMCVFDKDKNTDGYQKRVCNDTSGQPISFKPLYCDDWVQKCTDAHYPNFKDKNGIPGNYHVDEHINHPIKILNCDREVYIEASLGKLYYLTVDRDRVYTGKFLYQIKFRSIRVREKPKFSGF